MRCELHDVEMVQSESETYPRKWLCPKCCGLSEEETNNLMLVNPTDDELVETFGPYEHGPDFPDGPEFEGWEDRIMAARCPVHGDVMTQIGEDDAICETCFAEDKPANPKQAFGDKKVRLQLVPPVIEIYASLALGEGADKYGIYNYRDIPVEMMTYIGAIRRHLCALLDGEYMDPGYWADIDGVRTWIPPKPHIAGIIASAGIIADCWERGTIIDNRPAKGTSNALLEKYARDNRPGPDDTPDPRNEVPSPREDLQGDSNVGERSGGPFGYCPAPMFEECG
jgi:hypothetical protein